MILFLHCSHLSQNSSSVVLFERTTGWLLAWSHPIRILFPCSECQTNLLTCVGGKEWMHNHKQDYRNLVPCLKIQSTRTHWSHLCHYSIAFNDRFRNSQCVCLTAPFYYLSEDWLWITSNEHRTSLVGIVVETTLHVMSKTHKPSKLKPSHMRNSIPFLRVGTIQRPQHSSEFSSDISEYIVELKAPLGLALAPDLRGQVIPFNLDPNQSSSSRSMLHKWSIKVWQKNKTSWYKSLSPMY